MKTKSRIPFALLLFAGFALIYACNKSNSSGSGSTSTTTTTADMTTSADDQAQVSNESDAVSDDANTALYGSVSVSGSSASPASGSGRLTTMGFKTVDSTVTVTDTVNSNLICDASITYKDSAGVRTITITYNGSNCAGNRTRTGTVVVTLPIGMYWKDAGATATISIQNLTITRLSDNKVIVINGTKTFTNVSGGILADLANGTPITHTVTGNLSIAFPNNTTRTWNESKQRVFSYNDGIVITTTGTHTDSLGNTDVAEWGTTRYDSVFESLISEPKVFAQSCEYRLGSGQNEVLFSDGATLTITYGLDASGNATSCPGTGNYYYKLVIAFGGKTYTLIVPYY